MSAPLQVSCAFPAGPEVIAHAQLAEELGYERVWLYDSPAFYPDVWLTLARVAERTEHIGLGQPPLPWAQVRACIAQVRGLLAFGTVLDDLPGGPEWRAALECLPKHSRHLTTHEDHLVAVTEHDRPLLTGEGLTSFTWTGEAEALRARLDETAAADTTEILYQPIGPDVERELHAFITMASA